MPTHPSRCHLMWQTLSCPLRTAICCSPSHFVHFELPFMYRHLLFSGHSNSAVPEYGSGHGNLYLPGVFSSSLNNLFSPLKLSVNCAAPHPLPAGALHVSST